VKPQTLRHFDGTISRYPHEEPLDIPNVWQPHDSDDGHRLTNGRRGPTRSRWDEFHPQSKLLSREYLLNHKSDKAIAAYHTKPATTARWDKAKQETPLWAEYRKESVSRAKWSGHEGSRDDAAQHSSYFERAGNDVPGPFLNGTC